MLQVDPLFVGVTRPTMIAGVPYEALIVNGLITSVAFMGTGSLLYLLVFVPLHAVSYLLCKAEPRMFELLFLWVKTKGKCLNRGYWGCSCYSPMADFRPVVAKPKKDKK